MPSKEDICVVQDSLPQSFLSADMEELVAAIKHNLHLKSKPSHSVYSKHRRMSPYAATRTVCRKATNSDHSPSNCKLCYYRCKSPKDNRSPDPYEILNYLREGVLINEAVKRLQMDIASKRSKKTDFYDIEDVEVAVVESV